jgi:hypothetical protein
MESQSHSQLAQGQIILLGQKPTDLAAMGVDDHGLAPGKMMPGSNVASAAALLQEFLDHAERDTKTLGNLGPGAFVMVIRIQDALAEIQRERSHGRTVSPLAIYGYTIY